MKTKNLLSGFIFAIIIAFGANGYALEKKEAAHTSPEAAVQMDKKISADELVKVLPDDFVLGDSKAKVTVIEYASMTCPHCADFHKNTFPELKTKYIDNSKVKFIFRAFPLDEPALRASMMAVCSGKDKFFKFIDVIFSTQANWAVSKNYLEVLANLGKLGGMSGAEFDKCMANNELEKKVMQAKFDASTVLNVRSTPSFFINGTLYKGANNFEYFSKVVDEALGEKPKDASATTAPVTAAPSEPSQSAVPAKK